VLSVGFSTDSAKGIKRVSAAQHIAHSTAPLCAFAPLTAHKIPIRPGQFLKTRASLARCGVCSEGNPLRISQSQLPRERRLAGERRRALQLLASSPRGVAAELLVLAHEFSRDMLAGLVLAGLATVVAETLTADGPTIKIERVKITDAGRRAIEG
jgi:hypothetical protein